MSVLKLTKKQYTALFLPWIIWSISSLFYCHQYFLRISTSKIPFNLGKNFHINALTLSNVVGSFFYSYIIVQLFAGIIVDYLGSRIVLIFATLLCSLGCLLFIGSNHIFMIELSRYCLGAGAAFAIVISLTLTRNWFSKRQFAVLSGLTLTVGTLGAVFGGAPFDLLILHWGLKTVMIGASILGILLALLAFFMIEDSPQQSLIHSSKFRWKKVWKNIFTIMKDIQIWGCALYTGLLFVPIVNFATLWGTPFLVAEYHISNLTAQAVTSMMFIGLAVGSPLIGWISNLANNRVMVLKLGSLLTLVLMFVVLYVPHLPLFLTILLMFLIGFFIGCSALVFTLVKELTKQANTALVFSLTNIFQLACGALSLPIIGLILNKSMV